jgi:hypothetical protein
MITDHPLRQVVAAFGVAIGLVSLVGAISLIWGSQDAMRVLIHWVGEERALGSPNVVVQPDGSKLLTNPSAMARWVMVIWAVGLSQIVAGLHLLWTSKQSLRHRRHRLG